MEKITKKTLRGIDVHYINSDKFKTVTWSMVFTHPEGPKNINEYYFLSNALVDNMKSYPSNVLKYRYQASLYGLDAFGSAANIGNNIVNHFVISYPNEKYIEEETQLSKNAFIFLNEMITNPIMRNGTFTKKVLNENITEAKELQAILKSINDMFSYYRFSKVFYEDKPGLQFDFPEYDLLNGVTIDTFTSSYLDLFRKSEVSIFVAGDFEPSMYDEIILEHLHPRIVSHPVNKTKKMYPYDLNKEPKIIEETADVSQSRIFLGFLTNVEYFSEGHPAMSIFNNIFGGFDQSILFMDIREKHHLAYYVDSNYLSDENMITVSVSTSKKQEQVVIEKIKLILEQVKQGQFSDALFEQAKDNSVSSLTGISDSQSICLMQHIKSNHLTNSFYDVEARIQLYKNVTKEDVINAAKSLVLDTVYIYTKAGE